MRHVWTCAFALCGAVAFGWPTVSVAEQPGTMAELNKSDDELSFGSAKELLEHLDAEGKKLGRATRQQAMDYLASSLATIKKHLLANPEAKDHDVLYDWVVQRANYVQGMDDFFEIASIYLKANTDLANPNTYSWKKMVLTAELKNSAKKKDAEAELKKFETEGAKDAAKAVFAADIRVGIAMEAKDSKAAGEIVSNLRKNKLVTESKDPWVYRDYQRLVLAQTSVTVKEGAAFPCWSEVLPVKDLDGKEIKISDFKGKVLLIDFWATWCPPCMRAMPALIDLHDELKKDGFEMLGISFDNRGGEQVLRETIAGKKSLAKMSWRQIYDGGGWGSGFAARYGVRSVPRTVLIDRSGKVIAQGLHGQALIDKVREAVSTK